jgi:DNA-binding protein H-NS
MNAKTLKAMPSVELAALKAKIDKILPAKLAAERAELRERLDKLNKVRVGHAHPNKGKKLPAKYRGPNGEEWSGRGLRPLWLQKAINRGGRVDDYLVSDQKSKAA